MAGGVTKAFGFTFLILGVLLFVVGAGAAGYGLYMATEQENAGLFADPDAQDMAVALLYGGGTAAGVGLFLILVGGILLAIGGSMARRELLHAIGASGAATPGAVAPSSRKGWIVAGAIIAVLLLAGVVLALGATDQGDGVMAAFRQPDDAAAASAPVVNETFEGHVQGARAPVIGGLNTANSVDVHEMTFTPGTYALTATLDWSADAPTSPSSLVLILESESDGVWTEFARGEGGPGLVIDLPMQDLPANVRARVFVGGSGAADADYALQVVATQA